MISFKGLGNDPTIVDVAKFYGMRVRLDKAIAIPKEDVERVAPAQFKVRSQGKKSRDLCYHVSLVEPACDCMDWVQRGLMDGTLCKHIQASWIHADAEDRKLIAWRRQSAAKPADSLPIKVPMTSGPCPEVDYFEVC